MNTEHSLITITTDFGLQDEYVGLMKGVIHSINPGISVVDITHYIPPQDVEWTAYMIYYSFGYFPKGSIHVIVVDPGVGSNRQIKLVKSAGHYFLSPDNGVMTKVVNQYQTEEIRTISNRDYFLADISNTFHGRDIFAPVAAHLSNGVHPQMLGEASREVKTLSLPEPQVKDDEITGHVIHIDRFGNLITDIEQRKVDNLSISYDMLAVHLSRETICGIRKSYAEVTEGKVLGVFGSKGLLEISVNKGNAAELLDMEKGDQVMVSR
ncbi:MAG: SAM-dependent chlorinase/fluorinase [Bacteroidales bacterium]|nr:SAM-dependent chlorinase/fluorinase [Bacteroidales bacterium]